LRGGPRRRKGGENSRTENSSEKKKKKSDQIWIVQSYAGSREGNGGRGRIWGCVTGRRLRLAPGKARARRETKFKERKEVRGIKGTLMHKETNDFEAKDPRKKSGGEERNREPKKKLILFKLVTNSGSAKRINNKLEAR